ncbi:DNAL4-like protein [Mya arenaria]|uniref:DNAL4-like protein n=1 Tax=Mya arenaria TaxID=6604 RepID=A0ABY7DEQ5_MYAAR|nr:DNAL4-like protein [Mya arenaria]
MAEPVEEKKEAQDTKARVHTYPLIRNAARMIKETMDKKFGASWHAVVGEGFGFELTHEVKNLLYMFFGGNMAICIWKCS